MAACTLLSSMLRALIVLAVVSTTACGSSSKSAATASNIAAFQSGDPVKFEVLQGFLPSDEFIIKDGWQKSDMTGMALTVPIRGSQAALTLRKGDVEVVIDIIDTVFNQSLYAPVAAFLADGFATNDARGYKKAITFQNQPAFEEFTSADRTGGITVLVGKRYLVHLQGTGIGSTDIVMSVASQMNLTKLAELK